MGGAELATAQEDDTDAEPSETHEAELAVSRASTN